MFSWKAGEENGNCQTALRLTDDTKFDNDQGSSSFCWKVSVVSKNSADNVMRKSHFWNVESPIFNSHGSCDGITELSFQFFTANYGNHKFLKNQTSVYKVILNY